MDDKQKLLSITDEKSILITVEFVESGKILKVGEKESSCYELDLIVKKDITVNQLLLAIGIGIKEYLKSHKIDVENDDTSFIYSDLMYPQAETHAMSTEEIAKRAMDISSKKKRLSLLDKRNIAKAVKKWKRSEEHAAELSAKASQYRVEPEKKSEEKQDELENLDDELYGYLLCWNVFCTCFSLYLHPEEYAVEGENVTIPRKPVILLASANYNAFEMGKELFNSDVYQLSLRKDDGEKTLEKAGFITTSRLVFDCVGWKNAAALYDTSSVVEAFRDQTPLYNISERPLKSLDSESVHVIPPPELPKKNKQNILTTVLSPLLMTGMMVGVRLLSGSGTNTGSTLLMFGGMGAVSAVTAVINLRIRNKEHRESVQEWRTHYQNYIQKLIGDIQKKQADDVDSLQQLYPPARIEGERKNDLVSKALAVNGDIFSRGREHPDYLKIRIGSSTPQSELVHSVFEIVGEKKEQVFASEKYRNILNQKGHDFTIVLPTDEANTQDYDGTQGYLIDLPRDIAKTYENLSNAPVLLSLAKCRSLGIVFDIDYAFLPYLSNLIFDLCFYHSPEKLQIVMLCKPSKGWQEKQETIRRFKHLPHFRELLGDLSPFAFSKEDANLIFNKLLEVLSERKGGDQEKKSDTKYPQIVVIVLEEYELKSHLVSEYLPTYGEKEDEDSNISFVFCKRHLEDLPKYCEYTIRRCFESDKHSNWYLFPHEQVISNSLGEHPDDSRYGFAPDALPPEYHDMGNQDRSARYFRAFKSISALYYKRIAQGADVPERVELFDILGNSKANEPDEIKQDLKCFIYEKWWPNGRDKENSRSVSSLSVQLGKSSNGYTTLDLYEKEDGPHMLVAGTTGSGKTETVLTYLISLCANYSPEEVNLLLVDMKGAGFVDRIGNKNGKGKGRFLPHVVGTVTNISGSEAGTGTAYMLKRFLHSMNSEVERRERLLHDAGVDSVDGYMKLRDKLKDKSKLAPLPHLFLVIDEFSELMRFSSDNDDVDFRASVTSLARVGRSLGFHIILISQNIENAITPDIRVNSKARLCLKVATREASKEMIGVDLAASPLMPGNGRAYLLIGTGSKFEYFQSGYTGASITRHVAAPVIITNAEPGGKYSMFYDSENMPKALDLKWFFPDGAGPDMTGKLQVIESSQTKNETTQLEFVADCIIECFHENKMEKPHSVFQQPLPNQCYYDYDWERRDGEYVIVEDYTGRKD